MVDVKITQIIPRSFHDGAALPVLHLYEVQNKLTAEKADFVLVGFGFGYVLYQVFKVENTDGMVRQSLSKVEVSDD